MPVLLSFTMNTTSPNSSEAIHSPDIGRTSVDVGEIGVVGVEVGIKIGVSVGAGVGTDVSSTFGVRAGASVSSSTHPENITIERLLL